MVSRMLVVITVLIVASVRQVRADETTSPLTEDGHLVQFERDIVPILQTRCLSCHGPEDGKNDFRVDDSDNMMDYIEAGDWESSTMYVDYLTIDDPDLLMPPASHGGPLSAAELALIRVWIDEGAEWPEGVRIAEEPLVVVADVAPVPLSLPLRVWAFQGFFHPATVHFPIALLLVGALFVVLGWKWPALGTQVPLACLLLGAATSIVASVMGWSFAVERGYGGWTKVDFDSEFFWHRWSGVIVSVVATVLAVVAIRAVREQSETLTKVWKVGLLLVAGMVGAVGHQGGELNYGADFYPRAIRTLLGTNEMPVGQAVNEPVYQEPVDAEEEMEPAL